LFGYLSRRHGWLSTLAASWLAVLAADLALAQVHVPAGAALALALLALHAASALLRRQGRQSLHLLPTPWWDLPARAAATALLVLLVTGFAASLGPSLTGALAPLPIALSVVCAFTAAQAGQAGVLALLRGIVPGLDGFALFCFLVRCHDQQGGRCGGIWCRNRRRGDLCDLRHSSRTDEQSARAEVIGDDGKACHIPT
jgi:hypothetical protein